MSRGIRERLTESKAIFFDLFHTLFSFKSEGTPGRDTSDVLGIPDRDWSELCFHSSEGRMRGQVRDKYQIIKDMAHQYDPGIPMARIREAADLRENRFRTGLIGSKSTAIPVLKALRKSGFRLGLISNADCVEISGWPDSPFARYFDHALFSYQIGYMKPEPEIYSYAMEKLGVSASQSVFVGDGSNRELWGAKQLGMTTVLTTEMIQKKWPERIPSLQKDADYVVGRLSELVE